MTELQFDPMGEEPQPLPRKPITPGVWIAAAAAAIVVALGLWLMLRTPRAPALPAAAPAAPAPAVPETVQPAAPAAPAPEPQSPLPALGESDTFVRTLVGGIFASPELAEWLAGGEDLIQNGVRAVVAMAAQRSAHRFLAWLPIDGRFTARPHGSGLVIAPESYRRFDRVVDLFVGLDDAGIARLLARLGPLISESLDENAFPGTEFTPTLRLAIEHLLATPLPGDDLAVIVGEDGVYRFADPALEALSAPQKQLLRLGPSNGARVRAKLAGLARALATD